MFFSEEYQSDLQPDDLESIFSLVQSFKAKSLDPVTEYPEKPATAAQVQEIFHLAAEAGILPDFSAQGNDDPGLGLYEMAYDFRGLKLHLATLATIAMASPAIAWVFHKTALGYLINNTAGFKPGISLPLILEGKGTGRNSLAKLLCEASVTPEDQAILNDLFMNHERYFLSPFHDLYENILFIKLGPDNSIDFVRLPVKNTSLENESQSHGFDETPLAHITFNQVNTSAIEQAKNDLTADARKRLLIKVLNLEMLANMAIGTGAVKQSEARVYRYTAERVQGGKVINNHAAVETFLTHVSSAVAMAEAALNMNIAELEQVSTLARVTGLKTRVDDFLAHAATEALQAFGGYGYMQDYGLEKTLRDINVLRLLGGATSSLKLFSATLFKKQYLNSNGQGNA